jgi:hypothetical protein
LIDAVELAAAVVLIAVVTVAGDITGGIAADGAAGFAGQAVAVTGIDIAFRDCLSGTA